MSRSPASSAPRPSPPDGARARSLAGNATTGSRNEPVDDTLTDDSLTGRGQRRVTARRRPAGPGRVPGAVRALRGGGTRLFRAPDRQPRGGARTDRRDVRPGLVRPGPLP